MVKTLSAVAAHSIGVEHPLLEEHEQKKAAIAIVVVSDRGLAGGFNSNVFRMVDKYRAENTAAGIKTDVIVCGKKGASYFHYRRLEPLMVFRDMSADPTIQEAREISSYVRSSFLDHAVDEVKVFYNHARNAADQDLREEVILPVQADALKAEVTRGSLPSPPARVSSLRRKRFLTACSRLMSRRWSITRSSIQPLPSRALAARR